MSCISKADVIALRRSLEVAFSPDTALPGTIQVTPSSGHCAVVSALVFKHLGGEMVSTKVGGNSHWFNRLVVDGTPSDVDITGDQFGRPSVQIARIGSLYYQTRVRRWKELNQETIDRAGVLAARARKL